MTAGHRHETAPAVRPAMHTSAHTILWDPDGLIEAELPPDRVRYECLGKAVLAWTGPDTLPERDYE
ncbi:hypothetical protein SCOCK_580037 [Actinacidiphila cocklensis]|uniref:Uncharacterized protein n=1 Tax=Actinacidiphila cocklensis TaxID=887465 RepID=A0A9W4E1A7_9ACTN|nr:hypothetical protein SCOCK_580037 [Actinacidiphila cocklensis]